MNLCTRLVTTLMDSFVILKLTYLLKPLNFVAQICMNWIELGGHGCINVYIYHIYLYKRMINLDDIVNKIQQSPESCLAQCQAILLICCHFIIFTDQHNHIKLLLFAIFDMSPSWQKYQSNTGCVNIQIFNLFARAG